MAARSAVAVLFAHEETPWQVAILRRGETSRHTLPIASPDAAQIAESVSRVLGDTAASTALLAIPSSWCMSARVDTQNLPRRGAREALRFRFETKLPLSAEEILADALSTSPAQSLGVAASKAKIEPIVQALRSRQIQVQAICPTVLLGLQALLRTTPRADAIVYASPDELDLFTLKGDLPDSWSLLPKNADDVALRLSVVRPDHEGPVRVAFIGNHPIAAHADIERVAFDPMPAEDAALAMAQEVLEGRSRPWIDLARDLPGSAGGPRAVRGPLIAAACGVLTLAAALSIVLFVRASRYEALARDADRRAAQIAGECGLTKTRTDDAAALKRALQRHERDLRRQRGVTSELPRETSALMLLYQALSRLPTHLRLRVTEVRVSSEHLLLEGECLALGDVDAIAAPLRGIAGFEVEPPRTEQLPEQGVQFSITLRPVGGKPR